MNFSKALPTHAEGDLLSTLVVLGLAFALFGMPCDRNFSAHCFYITTAIAALDVVIWLIRHRGLPASVASQRKDLVLLCGGVLLMLASQLYWLDRVEIYPPFEWMGQYLKDNCVFWGCSILLASYVVLFNIRLLPVLQKPLLMLLAIVLVVCAIKGVHQYEHGIERISLKIDHPVPAGLVFATMVLIASAMSLRWLKAPFSYLMIVIAFTCGGLLVSLTQTRSALLMIFMAVFFVIWKLVIERFMQANVKSVFVGLVLLGIGLVAASFLNERFYNIYSDLHNYAHGNQGGSLGARLVMWKAGILSFIANPWGYSPTARFAVVETIIRGMTKNDPNVGIMISGYAKHHVHNEIIEVMSLEGIIGLLGVLSFHVSMIVVAWHKHIVDGMFRLFVCFIILFGISDPLFDSDKVGLLVSIAIPLLIALATSDRMNNLSQEGDPEIHTHPIVATDSIHSVVIRS